jgi:large subunit ribosomal protein L14
MIHIQTKLNVIDNSGAKIAQCIKVLKNKKFATIGDIIVVSIKDTQKNNQKVKIQKGDVSLALVVRTKRPIMRKDGSTLKFDKNSVILLHRNLQPLGTRVHGPLTHELRIGGYKKTIAMAERIL